MRHTDTQIVRPKKKVVHVYACVLCAVIPSPAFEIFDTWGQQMSTFNNTVKTTTLPRTQYIGFFLDVLYMQIWHSQVRIPLQRLEYMRKRINTIFNPNNPHSNEMQGLFYHIRQTHAWVWPNFSPQRQQSSQPFPCCCEFTPHSCLYSCSYIHVDEGDDFVKTDCFLINKDNNCTLRYVIWNVLFVR